jgi:DNA repair ATPase RecN
MPSPEERERSERSAILSGTVLPDGYLDDVYRVAAIYRTLGGLEKLVDGLGATTKSHTEEIKQITQRVYAIHHIKRDVAKNTKDLNEQGRRHNENLSGLEKRLIGDVNQLGRRHDNKINELDKVAHTADKLVRIGYAILLIVGGPLLLYLYHHVTLVFNK